MAKTMKTTTTKSKPSNNIKVKVDTSKIPNKSHLKTQQTVRANVFKPKKGKGSFIRSKKVEY